MASLYRMCCELNHRKRNYFNVLDMTEAAVPVRSKLFSLSPLFIGTIDVESLSSYINRISEAHSITNSTLFKELIYPNNSENIRDVFRASSSINGTSVLASSIALLMNELTLEDSKEHLTFLKLSEYVCSADIKKYRHWCPVCLENSRKNGEPIYEKLIWVLKSIDTCRIHKIPLQSHCPHCDHENSYIYFQSKNGYCNSCKGWLGCKDDGTYKNILTEGHFDLQAWIHNNLTALFKKNLNISREKIHGIIKTFLTTTLPNNNVSIQEFSRIIGYSRYTLYDWLKGKHSFSLESLFKLTYSAGIPLEQFLTTDLTILKFSQLNVCTPITIKRNTKVKLTIRQKGEKLKEILESEIYPPPKLLDVVKQLGYISPTSLSVHFPEECRIISQRYKSHTARLFQDHISKLEQELEKQILRCIEENIFPSRKVLLERIPIIYSHRQMRKIRNEILMRLGI